MQRANNEEERVKRVEMEVDGLFWTVSVWGDEEVLEIDSGDGCTTG